MAGVNKKHGRNEAFCKKYAAEQRREKNKAVKLSRYIRKCPWDVTARAAFDTLPVIARRGHVLPDLVSTPAVGIWRRVPATQNAA